MKLTIPEICYIYLRFWPKGQHDNPHSTHVIVKAICCFSQTDHKDVLVKTLPGEVKSGLT